MKVFAWSAFSSLLILWASATGADSRYPQRVSLVQLISNPSRFDGKLVSTTGFISIEREADFLYLGQEAYDHHLDDNAIWFQLSEDMGRNRGKLNHNYVILIGTFRDQRRGGGTNPNGGIDSVQKCSVISLGGSAAATVHQ